MDNIGKIFENKLSKEFGLKQTPNSGAVWYSKLDLLGRGGRWSLKATSKNSISISKDTIEEALQACAGEGSIPLWAFHINGVDIIAMTKEDFKLFQKGELQLIGNEVPDQVMERRSRASTPALLRKYE